MNRNIESLLQTELGAVLQTLEAERQRALHKVYPAVGGAIVLGLMALICFFRIVSGHFAALILLLFCVAGVAICAWAGQSAARSYTHAYKFLVHGLIIRSLDEGLTYSAYKSISEREFEDSRLFPRRIDRFRGEDLVEGCLGHTPFRFSEVHAEYRSQSSRDNTQQWHTVFRGLFFVADFNKHFVGETLVLPDNLAPSLGRFSQTLQAIGAKMTSQRGDLVKLEDPEFEREFAVFSTDQIEARYILSNSLMRRILNFQRKTQRPLYISFITTKIYVAIPCQRPMFEPSLFRSALSTAPLQEFLDDVQLMIGLVDDLDLNTRIWSKQPQYA